MADEGNRLGGRVRRYATVGRAVGGLAARVAGQRYLGLTIDKEKHAGELRAALGGLKGPLMKVAQILSTIPDALPKEYAEELAQLQSNAPSMGWPFVKRRMAAELGADWQTRFDRFEPTAAAAASLGQVHRAVLPDGGKVACKLQYPNMSSTVEADLRQLRLIFRLYERHDKSVSTENILAEISARLREELDYRREAANLRLYAAMLAETDDVHVPEAVPELSTGRLLTMSWLDGTPLIGLVDSPPEARNAAAIALFRAWYIPFYYYGVIHGDPHLGNYATRADGGLNLLDFGCIRVFPPAFVKGVIDLYRALRDGDEELAVAAYEGWGFTGLTREVVDVLNLWARFVYRPLMEDKVQRIQESESGRFGAQVAGKVHQELRRIGGVTPPREFVLMDRAAVGLGSVFLRLRADLNWYRVFHKMIEDFDVDRLAARQAAALRDAGVPPTE